MRGMGWRFQFTLKTMLILFFFVCVVCGWVAWPINTASRLGVAMASGDTREIARLTGMDRSEVDRLFPSEDHRHFANRQLISYEPRRLSDILMGRQHFIVGSSYRAVATCGRINDLKRTWFFGGIELKR